MLLGMKSGAKRGFLAGQQKNAQLMTKLSQRPMQGLVAIVQRGGSFRHHQIISQYDTSGNGNPGAGTSVAMTALGGNKFSNRRFY